MQRVGVKQMKQVRDQYAEMKHVTAYHLEQAKSSLR